MELLPIGELARRTGLTVKAIRFYADRGIVPPTGRSASGHRRYDTAAVARLELVRTLRELGLDLATIRRVVDREADLAEVAATHADALAVQIRTLSRRHAVLSAVARHKSTPEEMDLMHRLARLSAHERRHLIDTFLGTAFAGLPNFAGITRTLTPELPDDPEPAQLEAWVELAELVQDPGFAARLRLLAELYTDVRSPGLPRPDPVALVRDHDASVDAVLAHYPDREQLTSYLEAAADPRRERYLELLSVINGWPPPEPLTPVLTRFLSELRSR
ncbi:MerR family transcriptional regulator [Actinoplanes friuliensis]|uniref:Regulatory protein MerR n=1 Tax=Actinoplanes friuliensis DSM 7358 TaxID=1246995 RepID=U5W7Q3_9ACTN|nr:MerR family transcriptional regulator [Actinoplanes friuliensis]AGZ45149.1 regulatory protein MerR [Actinoplanes friuliensis DSM 7358]